MEEALGRDEERWVYDSTTDHRGRIPLRASTGVWKASLFIFASLIIYLTRNLHKDLKTAVLSLNIWRGVTTLLPLVGGFVADVYLGQFNTVLLSTFIYVLGLTLLTISTIQRLRPCHSEKPCPYHENFFYLSIYLISVGIGGHRSALESFGADQFDDDHPEERKKKMSFFNWWNVVVSSGLLMGVTTIVFIQEHVSWYASYVILTVIMASSIVIICAGRPLYRFRKTRGTSSLKPMFQVIIAAIAKRKLLFPSTPDNLYEDPKSSHASNKRVLCHTDELRFLDKAAILEDFRTPTDEHNPWRLSTVTQVEEVKLIFKLVPIWLTAVPFTICMAQTITFFIKQASTTDNALTKNIVIPPTSIVSLTALAMIITVIIYEKMIVPLSRKVTGNERGITTLQRIGIGMTISLATMITAALIEKKRLRIVQISNQLDKALYKMSICWLAPQFLLTGVANGFTLVGLQEHFYNQVPKSMRSIAIAFYLSVIGAGEFVSSILIVLVDRLTEDDDGSTWIGKDLNNSRLDYFYWFLAVMAQMNLCIYIIVTSRNSYTIVTKTVSRSDHEHNQVLFF